MHENKETPPPQKINLTTHFLSLFSGRKLKYLRLLSQADNEQVTLFVWTKGNKSHHDNKFLWASTTQQLAALKTHNWVEIIFYQCASGGATPGLWKETRLEPDAGPPQAPVVPRSSWSIQAFRFYKDATLWLIRIFFFGGEAGCNLREGELAQSQTRGQS